MRWLGALAIALAIGSLATVSGAQPGTRRRTPSPAPTAATERTNLRAHVGTDHAARLIRSADPDERIRGIQLAAAIGTQEAISLLVESL